MAEELDPQTVATPPADAKPTSQQMISDMPDVFASEPDAQTTPDTSLTGGAPDGATQAAGSPQPPAGSPQAEPAVSPVIERLRSLGFQDVADERQGTERLLTAFEQSRQQQETLAMQMDQLRQQNLVMQTQLAQSVNQPGRQAPASVSTSAAVEPADPWPKIPDLDIGTQQAIQKYRLPDGGWQPNTPPTVIQRASEWQSAVEDWQTKLVMDPKAALQPIIDHEVQRAIQQVMGGEPKEFINQQLEQRSQQETQQTEVAQAWERVTPWMWQADPITQQPSRNPTEFGRRFQYSFQQEQARLKQLAPDLDEDSLFYHSMQGAYARHEAELQSLEYQWQQYTAQQQQPVAPATPAAPPEPQVDPRDKARQEFLARNRQNPNPNGQRSGAMPEDSRGRRRGPRTQGANAVGVEFVESLAGDGFFA